MAVDTQSSCLLPLIAFQHHVGSLFIPPEEVEFICELGVGDLAVVEHGRWRRGASSKLPVVVKGYKPFVVGSPQDFRELLLEASKLHRLRHPNITHFLGLGCFSHGSLAEVRESMFMVEEYVGTRNLRKLIGEQMRCRLKNLYSMQTALRWAAEAASALAALHEQQPAYIHGDVKADNVFLTDCRAVDRAVAKLGDLKPHRHVYDREPSMLSQHQALVAAKQVPQGSLASFNLKRSSCSSSGSAGAWPTAGTGGSSCSSLVSESGDHHHSLWQGRMQQQQQPETHLSLQPQQQPQEQPQQQWDAGCTERAHSLPVAIGTPRSGSSSSMLQGAGSCPAAWDPASTLDADATCCAVSPPSGSWSRAEVRGLRGSSLGSAGEVHGCDGAAGAFATSRSLPLSSCLSASELEGSAAVKSAAAEAAAAGSEHDPAAAAAAAAGAGEDLAGRRRSRAVCLSDSASSTTSASSGSAHVKPAVGLVSLAAAEDDDDEEQLSPSMRRLLREAAAADELHSSGSSSPLGQPEDRQHQQQLLQHQGSNSSSLLQDDFCDCSAHGGFRAVSLGYSSQSLPEIVQQVVDEQQQQPRVELTSAHSAPAEIGAGALLRDSKVHHGTMMPLSAPMASQGEALMQLYKQQQPQQQKSNKQQQQPGMFSSQLSHSKQEQAAAAQAGPNVCYGWELSPSGAASPCGAVHSTMLDLFADMAEEEVLLCRRPRDQYTLSPGSSVQHRLQPNVTASNALQVIKAAQQQQLQQQQSWEPAFSSVGSCPAPLSSSMSQGGLERTGSLRGGAPSAIESKQHGSSSAFAALTAIDCIREETSSIATDSVMGSCPASRESTAHGGVHHFQDAAYNGKDQAQGLRDISGAVQQHNGSLYSKAGSGMQGQHAGRAALAANALMSLRSISSSSGSQHNTGSSDSISEAFAAAAAAVAEEEERQQQEHDSSSMMSNGSIAEQVAALDAAAADVLTPRSCLHRSNAVAADGTSMPGSRAATADKASAVADDPVGGQKRVRFTVERPAGIIPSRDYSLLYAAPELLSGQRPTEKVDVFAFGVLLYELLSRSLLISHCAAAVGHNRSCRGRHGSSGSRHGGSHSPHANASSAAADAAGVTSSPDSDGSLPEQQLLLAYAQMVAGGYRPPFPAHFPAPVVDLISSCWAAEPHQRPRMSDVLTQLQACSKDRQLVYCLDSYLAGLADLGYGPGSMTGPSCGCGCVIS